MGECKKRCSDWRCNGQHIKDSDVYSRYFKDASRPYGPYQSSLGIFSTPHGIQ
jgi:hypothetical protein